MSNWPSHGQQRVSLQSRQGLALLDVMDASGSFLQDPPLWPPCYQKPGCEKSNTTADGKAVPKKQNWRYGLKKLKIKELVSEKKKIFYKD